MAEPTEAVPEQVTRVRQDRRTIKRPIEYTAHLDTLQLIVRFLISARDGAPFSFATFKSIWKQIGYSHIFQVGIKHLHSNTIDSSWCNGGLPLLFQKEKRKSAAPDPPSFLTRLCRLALQELVSQA